MILHATRTCLSGMLIALALPTIAQNATTAIGQWLHRHHEAHGLTESDATDWTVTSSTSGKQGVDHVYIRQHVQGLPVHGAVANFAVRNGQVLHFGDRLVRDAAGKANAPHPRLTALNALHHAGRALGLPTGDAQVMDQHDPTRSQLACRALSRTPIPAELIYQATLDGRVVLAWDLTIRADHGNNWWHLAVDAATGELVRTNDYVTHCAHPSHAFGRPYDALHDLAAPAPTPKGGGAGYRVFPFPTESPAHGPHVLVTAPADITASPHGWHDVNGVAGAEYTITRGNNVYAGEDLDNDDVIGYSPDGGPGLLFDFPYPQPELPVHYLDASITNLFYTCNVMHDVWYHYGFDEQSGNFQRLNLTGTGQDQDEVIAQAQDGGGMNNANFASPPDGSNGYMQMYLWRVSDDSTLVVNTPAAIAGYYPNAAAGFGPPVPTTPLTADLVAVLDNSAPATDGCGTILNVGAIAGRIALVDRGNCTFVSKVIAMENSGAVAVIVVNNVPGVPVAMGGSGGENIGIPSIMISQADGQLIRDALANGPVNATLQAMGEENLRDSGFDNGIIAHEYGHGISTRLTGGAANSDCLWNEEQMGEGWSDWFGLMLSIRTGDHAGTSRGVGTFVKDETNDGIGIRPAPYTRDLALNGYTYDDTNNPALTEPHGVGFVWATMLWDMTWALIDQYGYDPNVYTGSGGNNIAMQLVIDGLKLQPCNPGFVDGRNAILLADSLNNGGANSCLIWNAFAQRGLGLSAHQGSPFSRSDQTGAFDMPAGCTVGMAEPGRPTDDMVLLPNPARDHASVQLALLATAGTQLILHASDGRMVRRAQVATGADRVQLDLAGVAPGVYVVELRGEGRSLKQRLVVH